MTVNKYRSWFRKFISDNIDILDIVQPVESDNDALNSLVELDPKWTMQEIADTFRVTRSIVQRYLHEIEKLSRFNSCEFFLLMVEYKLDKI